MLNFPAIVPGCVGSSLEPPWRLRMDDGRVRAATAAEILEVTKAARIVAVKLKARAVILARMPEWKQANATARAVELVSLGQASGPEWQAMQAAWAWVRSVREYSDRLEAAVAASDDPGSIDISTGWPG